MKINKLPAFTFGWLKMNEANVETGKIGAEIEAQTVIPETFETAASMLTGIQTGAGEGMEVFEETAKPQIYAVKAGVEAAEPMRIKLHFDNDKQGAFAPYGFVIESGACATVVMDLSSAQPQDVISAVQTKIELKEGAKLNLVQVIRAGKDSRLINDIGADLADDAELHIYHVILGGKAIYQGARGELHGDRSQMTAEIGYIAEQDHIVDMNYFANQTGKKTHSEIHAKGVLRNEARKLLRATIDFKRGCAGSTGNEQEDVLLMDDTIVNQTIPLILCAEEDVEGNHGATIGRIDEDSLFYLCSRGIPEAEVYEVMAKASLDSVIRQIPDAETIRSITGEEEA